MRNRTLFKTSRIEGHLSGLVNPGPTVSKYFATLSNLALSSGSGGPAGKGARTGVADATVPFKLRLISEHALPNWSMKRRRPKNLFTASFESCFILKGSGPFCVKRKEGSLSNIFEKAKLDSVNARLNATIKHHNFTMANPTQPGPRAAAGAGLPRRALGDCSLPLLPLLLLPTADGLLGVRQCRAHDLWLPRMSNEKWPAGASGCHPSRTRDRTAAGGSRLSLRARAAACQPEPGLSLGPSRRRTRRAGCGPSPSP